MYLARIELENIRGFSGSRNIDLEFVRPDGSFAGWTVIAGRNGSGKTSLLRAIALALAGSGGAQTLAPWYFAWSSKEDEEGVIRAHFFLDSDDVSSLSRGALSPEEGVTAGTEIQLPVLRRRKSGRIYRPDPVTWTDSVRKVVDPEKVQDPYEEGGEGEGIRSAANWFAAGYGPFRRLSVNIPSGHGEAERPEEAERFATLFNEDSSLTEGVAWLVGLHLRKLEKKEGAEALLESVLDLLGDSLLPDGYSVEKVDSEGLWVRRNGDMFPLREMSDGYRTVTALVLDVVRHIFLHYGELKVSHEDGAIAVGNPGVVLVDEIDAHLHVSWQQRIGDWLKRHFPRMQFIVTTHSPYICQAADPSGLIRLPGPDEDAPARTVDEEMYHRIVYGSGDDAALSGLFGLDSPYSSRAESLRQELVQLEGRVLAGEASVEEIERFTDISQKLNSSLSARVDEVAARLGGNK